MDPSASYVNIYMSIEKFLWDNLAKTNSLLLINQDDITTRLRELEAAEKAILWKISSMAIDTKGSIKLFVGVTHIRDPGSVNTLTIFDELKNLFDTQASIPVYAYTAGVAGSKVNELAFVGPKQVWPMISEPNGFKTMLLSIKMLFGQKVS